MVSFQTWLTAAYAKGLEVQGTFQRKNKELQMVLTFTNRAMQPLGNFAIQLNKNRLVCFSLKILFCLQNIFCEIEHSLLCLLI